MNEEILDEEFLYRGIIENLWDYENNRPTSAIFKDSKGVSVDRSCTRNEKECIDFLRSKKSFFKVCNIKVIDVKEADAVVLYKKIPDNIYHCEIHNSVDQVQIKGSKAKKLRDKIFKVFD